MVASVDFAEGRTLQRSSGCLLDGTLAQEREVDGTRHDFQSIVDGDDGAL